MGFFSSIGNAISSGISSACNFISGAVSLAGSAVSSLAKALITPFPEISVAEVVLKCIVSVVSFIAEAIGVKDKAETSEEIGAKAMQCDKNPEDFKSTEAYIEHLRNEIQLDKEKFENMSAEKKLACTALGVSIYTKAIEENENIIIPVEFLHEVAKVNMKGNEVKAYIESFKNNGLTNMGYISDYLKGNLEYSKVEPVNSAVMEALKNLNPNLSKDDIEDSIIKMKQDSRSNEGM